MSQLPDLTKMTPESQYDLLMRAFPHTYAEYVTRDNKTGKSEWVAARHLAYVSKRIALGIAKGNARIIVNMPARHGKSMLISKWLPTWYLENNPTHKVMVCSYAEDLAKYWGGEVRDAIAKNPNIRLKLRESSTGKGEWHTDQGGGMKVGGVGSGITGWGYNIGLIDDAHKDYQDANSPVVQESIKMWYQSTFFTRREPGASIVVLMHRWCTEDLCGYLLQDDMGSNWEVIRLPAIAETGDMLGRKEGEALWPERWPADSFKEAQKSLFWSAMFQQNPKSELGERVYDHFIQADNTAKETPLLIGKEYNIGLTLDFNVNPGMHGLIVQYDPRQDMLMFDTEFHGERWRTEHLMKEAIKWFVQMGHVEGKGNENLFPWKMLNIYGDRSGRTQNTVTSDTDYILIVKMLTEAGIPHRICVPMANPPVNDRVITLNEALRDNAGEVHCKINVRCVRLLVDMNKQPRDEDGQPDKTNPLLGHAGDAAGYSCFWLRPTFRQEFKAQPVVGM